MQNLWSKWELLVIVHCMHSFWCSILNWNSLVLLWQHTTPMSPSPLTAATNCSATSCATFSWASAVLAPRWGVASTLGWPIRERKLKEGERKSVCDFSGIFLTICLLSKLLFTYFSFGGSCVNTSRAAPPHWPLSSALSKDSSSMIPPLATLITLTPFLHFANTASFKRPYKEYEAYGLGHMTGNDVIGHTHL